MTVQEHDSKYLTLAEAADRLGISVTTVRKYMDRGELPAVRLGGPGSRLVRIVAADLERFAGRHNYLDA